MAKLDPKFDFNIVKIYQYDNNNDDTADGNVELPDALGTTLIKYPDSNYIPHENDVETLFNSLQAALFNYYEYLFFQLDKMIGTINENTNVDNETFTNIGEYIDRFYLILNNLTNMKNTGELSETIKEDILNYTTTFYFKELDITVSANNSTYWTSYINITYNKNVTGYYCLERWSDAVGTTKETLGIYNLKGLVIDADTNLPIMGIESNESVIVYAIPVFDNTNMQYGFEFRTPNGTPVILDDTNDKHIKILAPYIETLKTAEDDLMQFPYFYFNPVFKYKHTHEWDEINVATSKSEIELLQGLTTNAAKLNDLALIDPSNNKTIYPIINNLEGLDLALSGATLTDLLLTLKTYKDYTNVAPLGHIQRLYKYTFYPAVMTIDISDISGSFIVRHNIGADNHVIYMIPTTNIGTNIYTVNAVANNYDICKVKNGSGSATFIVFAVPDSSVIDISSSPMDTTQLYDKTINSFVSVYPDRYPDDLEADSFPNKPLFVTISGTSFIVSSGDSDDKLNYDVSNIILSDERIIEYGTGSFDDTNGVTFDMTQNNRMGFGSSGFVIIFPTEDVSAGNYWIELSNQDVGTGIYQTQVIKSSGLTGKSFLWFIPKIQ